MDGAFKVWKGTFLSAAFCDAGNFVLHNLRIGDFYSRERGGRGDLSVLKMNW